MILIDSYSNHDFLWINMRTVKINAYNIHVYYGVNDDRT